MVKLLRGNKGQTLIIGAIALALIAAFASLMMVKVTGQESKEAVKTSQVSQARGTAQAALEKVEWRLSSDRDLQVQLTSGSIPAGFNNDIVYTDIAAGQYKVKASAGPGSNQYTLVVKARDHKDREVKAVEAVYDILKVDSMVIGGLSVIDFQWGSGVYKFHWAPLKATTISLGSQTSTINLRYPRKISAGQVQPAASYPGASGGDWVNNSTEVFTNVQSQIDMPYYVERAKSSQVPIVTAGGYIQRGYYINGQSFIFGGGSEQAVASPDGSGYFSAAANQTVYNPAHKSYFNFTRIGASIPGYSFRSSTSVIVFDSDSSFANSTSVSLAPYTFIEVEAMLINPRTTIDGEFMITGQGGGVINATIPARANLEYAHATAAPVWTAGAPSMATVWASPGRCCYAVSNVAFKGLLYANAVNLDRGMPYTNSVSIVGVLVTDDATAPWGFYNRSSADVYYDEAVAQSVRLRNPPLRTRWKPVNAAW